MISHDRDAIHFVAAVIVGGQQILCVLREVPDRKAGRHVPECKHRVGLAATKVGLQVNHGRGVVITGESPHCPSDQVTETLGEVGALEEFDGIGVARVVFATDGERSYRHSKNGVSRCVTAQ